MVSTLKEEKVFRIKGLPPAVAALYGSEGYVQLSKQELIDAIVKVELEDFLFDVKIEVYGFNLYLPNGKVIEVEGNRMSKEAIKAIMKLKNKKKVMIYNIRYIKNPNPTTEYKRIESIVVEITDKKE
jgi:hypothetical protein